MPRRHIPLQYASLCNRSWTVSCGQDRGVHGGILVSKGRSDGRMDGRTNGIRSRTSYYLRPRRGVPLDRARVTSQSCCHTSKMLLHYNEFDFRETTTTTPQKHPPPESPRRTMAMRSLRRCGRLARMSTSSNHQPRRARKRHPHHVDFLVVTFTLFHRSSISTYTPLVTSSRLHRRSSRWKL